jgi:four helix bundle protein
MLYLSQRLGYTKAEDSEKLIEDIAEISKIIRGLIRSLIPK